MKRSSRIYLPEDESYRIAVELCGEARPTIVDGGAHLGTTVDAFRIWAPEAEFHCFEPDPQLVAHLQGRFQGDLNVHVVGMALGREAGAATININASRPTNSLLQTAVNLQPDLRSLCETVAKVDVRVISIDEYCRSAALEKVDIIKLDLQGYDYQALLGARETLARTRVVLAEVFFTEVYQEGHLFSDILWLMAQSGFRLYTLSGIHYGSQDELLWGDAIFFREQPNLSAISAVG